MNDECSSCDKRCDPWPPLLKSVDEMSRHIGVPRLDLYSGCKVSHDYTDKVGEIRRSSSFFGKIFVDASVASVAHLLLPAVAFQA